MADKKPSSANEVLASVNEDHDWKHEPTDLHSTGGIQRACERNAAAIKALADYIDGKSTRAVPGYEAPDAVKGAPAAVKGDTRTPEQVRQQAAADQARNQPYTPAPTL